MFNLIRVKLFLCSVGNSIAAGGSSDDCCVLFHIISLKNAITPFTAASTQPNSLWFWVKYIYIIIVIVLKFVLLLSVLMPSILSLNHQNDDTFGIV